MTAPHTPGEGGLSALLDLGGLGLAIIEAEAGRWPGHATGPGVIRLGLHRGGPRPLAGLDGFDLLLTADPDPPAPWVAAGAGGLEPRVARLQAVVAAQPVAATVCAQVLRMTLALPFDQALVLESLAYSMLLAGGGFRQWRARTPPRPRPGEPPGRVALSREAGILIIRLVRPAARNAFDAAMRDALVEALDFALDDPDQAPVVLEAEGPGFSAGGDLAEFGQAADPAQAHAIRVLQSPARLIHTLGPRLTARLHGACIGAGIEAPAAAARVVARQGAVFRLPEVSMGLIPGAGGTATLPRRIGRQRAAYMALSGVDIDLATALDWGLADEAAAD